MPPLLLALSAFVAAVIQRLTGLGFVLVLTAPVVMMYGALPGTAVSVLLALIASASALPLVWQEIEWKRVGFLLLPALAIAPVAAWVVGNVSDATLLLLVAGFAILALTASRIPFLIPLFRGKKGVITTGLGAGFLHVTSGLSGPVLAAHAVGTNWAQRSFSSSVQAIFVGLSAVSVLLRGFPPIAITDVLWGAAATIAGIFVGTMLIRFVPTRIARIGMLTFAWLGALIVLVRGLIALFA